MSVRFAPRLHQSRIGRLAAMLMVLGGCTSPKAECDQVRGAIDEGSSRLQDIYEGNRGGSGFTQGVERQIAQIYFDMAQVVDGLPIDNRQLQTVQFELVEAYQRASDYRYRAAEIMAAPPTAIPQRDVQVRELQLEADAGITAASAALEQRCPT